MTEQSNAGPENHDKSEGLDVGLGAAYGVAFGVILFALTGEAFWIAIGPALGVGIAAAFAALRNDD